MWKVLLATLVIGVGVLAETGTASAAIPVHPNPGLQLVRSIKTNPFVGSTVKPRDAEGLAYVPRDNSIWLADDNASALYEINANTGRLKRTITQAQLAAAVRVGGTDTAGTNTANDFEALAYDKVNDVLYVFAGKCCTPDIRAAAFRLTRRAGRRLQVESFQPFTAPLDDFSGVAAVQGQVWTALGQVLYRYDYATNTFSDSFTLSGVPGRFDGMGFSPDGVDLWVVNNSDNLYRVNWSSRTVYPNHAFSMAAAGITDSRAVEVVGNKLFICDGYDFHPVDSPDRFAIKVYKLVNLAAAMTAEASIATAPPPVVTNAESVPPPETAVSATPAPQPATDPVTVPDVPNVDAANEASTTAPVSTSATTVTIPVTADAMVGSTSPAQSLGATDSMRGSAGGDEYRPYLQFDVSGLTGTVTRAVLRLYVLDGTGSTSWHAVASTWSESSLTWANAPAISATPVVDAGNDAKDAWIEVDVTAAVSGNGTISFAGQPTAGDVVFSSKEGLHPPQLVVTTT